MHRDPPQAVSNNWLPSKEHPRFMYLQDEGIFFPCRLFILTKTKPCLKNTLHLDLFVQFNLNSTMMFLQF